MQFQYTPRAGFLQPRPPSVHFPDAGTPLGPLPTKSGTFFKSGSGWTPVCRYPSPSCRLRTRACSPVFLALVGAHAVSVALLHAAVSQSQGVGAQSYDCPIKVPDAYRCNQSPLFFRVTGREKMCFTKVAPQHTLCTCAALHIRITGQQAENHCFKISSGGSGLAPGPVC